MVSRAKSGVAANVRPPLQISLKSTYSKTRWSSLSSRLPLLSAIINILIQAIVDHCWENRDVGRLGRELLLIGARIEVEGSLVVLLEFVFSDFAPRESCCCFGEGM